MKPTITVKQSSHVTTVSLKGVPFAYIVTTNDKLQKLGIIGAINEKLNACKAKGYKHSVEKYETLLQALGA